jgi:DNA modification methylase
MGLSDAISGDYSERSYLSSTESARYLGITVEKLHSLVDSGSIEAKVSASGQMRFSLTDLSAYETSLPRSPERRAGKVGQVTEINVRGTLQKIVCSGSQSMRELESDSVNLMVTSPPYFDAKMYSREEVEGELGSIHDVDSWFVHIAAVWREVHRTLQPGRKAFINIMNLPVRLSSGGFKSLNLVGRTIDVMEDAGFVFKRDIVWHKTNSVRAHFGTYPYPGGILLNNSHEFILEFEKPAPRGYRKYAHLTLEQKEHSRIDRDFWLLLKNSDVWTMHPEGSGDRRRHVAPFPLELPSRIIRAYSYEGETVLDPFLGSGTSLVAAARLGRNGVGYEIVGEIALGAISAVSSA